jgi:tetratricopeptide (TPR) repeat protein
MTGVKSFWFLKFKIFFLKYLSNLNFYLFIKVIKLDIFIFELKNNAINLNNLYAKAYCNKGNSLNELNKNDEAIEAYNRAIEIDANYINATNNKGVSLLKLKRYDEAIKCFGINFNLSLLILNSLFNSILFLSMFLF